MIRVDGVGYYVHETLMMTTINDHRVHVAAAAAAALRNNQWVSLERAGARSVSSDSSRVLPLGLWNEYIRITTVYIYSYSLMCTAYNGPIDGFYISP